MHYRLIRSRRDFELIWKDVIHPVITLYPLYHPYPIHPPLSPKKFLYPLSTFIYFIGNITMPFINNNSQYAAIRRPLGNPVAPPRHLPLLCLLRRPQQLQVTQIPKLPPLSHRLGNSHRTDRPPPLRYRLQKNTHHRHLAATVSRTDTQPRT